MLGGVVVRATYPLPPPHNQPFSAVAKISTTLGAHVTRDRAIFYFTEAEKKSGDLYRIIVTRSTRGDETR